MIHLWQLHPELLSVANMLSISNVAQSGNPRIWDGFRALVARNRQVRSTGYPAHNQIQRILRQPALIGADTGYPVYENPVRIAVSMDYYTIPLYGTNLKD